MDQIRYRIIFDPHCAFHKDLLQRRMWIKITQSGINGLWSTHPSSPTTDHAPSVTNHWSKG